MEPAPKSVTQDAAAVAPRNFTYNRWIESLGVPIHKGFYVEDLRTLRLGWGEEQQCNAAFIELMGQVGVTSSCVTEISPGKTVPATYFALDDLIYVIEGRGLATVWPSQGK